MATSAEHCRSSPGKPSAGWTTTRLQSAREPLASPGVHPSSPLVARVVPDVTGLDKQFDYLVPETMHDHVAVGAMVRILLNGRRAGGWIVELGQPDGSIALDRLVPLARWSGIGPSAEIIHLGRWAATRWGAGRLRPFLVAASPHTMVSSLPPSTGRVLCSDTTTTLPPLIRLPPADDQLSVVVDALGRGPALVVHPSVDVARRLAA